MDRKHLNAETVARIKAERIKRAAEITALNHLMGSTTFAARFALGAGVGREDVARVLEDLANAIRNPGDVAEDMSPITLDEI